MKQICALFLLINAFNGTAQVKERFIHGADYTFTNFAVQNGVHIYMDRTENLGGSRFGTSLWLLKLDLNLTTVDSLGLITALKIPQGNYLALTHLNTTDKGNLRLLIEEEVDTVWNSRNTWFKTMHYIEIDENLIVLKQFKISSNSYSLRLFGVIEKNDSLVFAGGVFTPFSLESVILTYDSLGALGRMIIYPDSLFDDFGGFRNILRLNNDNFILERAVGAFSAPEILIELDNTFQLKKRIRLNTNDYSMSRLGFPIKHSNEFSYLSTNRSYQINGNGFSENYFTLGVAHLDSNLNLQKIDTLPFSGFNNESPQIPLSNPSPGFDSFDRITNDSVIGCVSGQFMHEINFAEQFANDIYIYNYNLTNTSLNWMRVYNSGYTNHVQTIAEALPGNRFLIGLNEYNWDKYATENTSIHLMIIDGSGNILGAAENALFNNSVSMYPNPSQGIVHFEGLPKNTLYKYRLVDMMGKEQFNNTEKNCQFLDLSHLQKGNYVLQILDPTTGFGIAKTLTLY